MTAVKAEKQLIFISYSSFDTEAKGLLERHLGVLQNLGDFHVWEDSQIGLGDDWFQEIQNKLETCSVAVLLISHDFLGSKFCMREEVPILLERRRREGMMVAPILLAPCAWKLVPWLQAIQMFPRKAKPLEGFSEFEQAEKLTEVVVAVHAHLEKRKAKAAEASTEEIDLQPQIEAKPDTPFPPLSKDSINLTRLPTSGYDVVGRDRELLMLDEAFDDGKLNIISLRAWGGVGKSTLVNKWCDYLAANNYRGARRIFAWSFFSQGTDEDVTSADVFIDEALRFFGEGEPAQGSPWARGERLAELVGKEKALLILDGMEPLQDEHQGIKDPALARLVECLAERNAGLCVITTREPVKELLDFPETAVEENLEQLSKEAGRALLRIKGLRAADDVLEKTSEAFGNHALALDLLASYLKRFRRGDVQQALAIPDLPDVPIDAGKHPRRIMAAFAEQFGEGPEMDLLHVIGLFDRPADNGCITALRNAPAIPDLTEEISKLDDLGWLRLLRRLRELGLIAKASHHAPDELDAHPRVREHFAVQPHAERSQAWKAGHERLYKYLQSVPNKHRPDTLAEMVPLFEAVRHGCLAGRRQESFDSVYKARIVRGNKFFITKGLGAFGADLGLLASFFTRPFSQPAEDLAEQDRAWLLNQAAFDLRALGRLDDAVVPARASMNIDVKLKNWKGATVSAIILLELKLALGDMAATLVAGHAAMAYADLAHDPFFSMAVRTALADAKLQAGMLDEAKLLFEEAETIQSTWRPSLPKLYSIYCFRYCDLLLTLGRAKAASSRARNSLDISKEHGDLLSLALDHLTLGRTAYALGNQDDVRPQLDQAVDGLRESGSVEFLTRGLLARAAFSRETNEFTPSRRDLDEVMRLSTRSGMRLQECDAHLEYARLALAEGQPDAARVHLKSADALVSTCGYHRRDGEVAELKKKLGQ